MRRGEGAVLFPRGGGASPLVEPVLGGRVQFLLLEVPADTLLVVVLLRGRLGVSGIE